MSWLRALTVLFLFLAAFGRPATASAFVAGASASPEARVGAFELTRATLVGAEAYASPGLHEGIGRAYDGNASGYRFAARGVGRSLDDLSASGRLIDPADKAGRLTRAGRALQKHGSRPGSAFPRARGNPSQINQAGQNVLDDILTTPGSVTRSGNRFGGVDVITPGGRGARFDANGVFRGLLEP